MNEQSQKKTSHGSMWADCAECESENTTLGPLLKIVVCHDCGAETEGINKMGDL